MVLIECMYEGKGNKKLINILIEGKAICFSLFSIMGKIMKKIHKGIIKEVKTVAKNTVCLTFEPSKPIDIKPGQFISILCDNLTLRRPFSVANFDGKIVTVLFKLKGKGTAFLSNLKPGDEIDFIGALGNGYSIKDKKALLIGAGIGLAPPYYLRQVAGGKLVGAFNSADEIPQGFEPDEVITFDGSAGKKGSILDHLEGLIDEYKPEIIYACGPHIVLEAIAKAGEKHGIETQIAMEKIMACGIGVCKGCVIKIKQGVNISGGLGKSGQGEGYEVVNKTICHDGPVFKGSEVVW